MSRVRDTIVVILIMIGMAVAVRACTGCLPRAAKEAAAEGTYLGQQLECVDNLEKKEDIQGCRESVKRRWAKKDGGK